MIIITGFGPFGKNLINLSGEIVKNFPYEINGTNIKKKILPVSWRCNEIYGNLLSSLDSQPKLVVLMGVYSNNAIIRMEQYSWNWAIGRDIENRIKFGLVKFKDPIYLQTIINLQKVLKLTQNDVEIRISNNAGFYLCNYSYFYALKMAKREYPVLFLHIPNLGKLEKYIKGVKQIINAVLSTFH
ncbi:MAG: hypothetical protein GY870_02240 [archaeon]|nr:hypothetical protein [archaeon]